MNLNYEWYRTFYTVVKEGGFSKAADKLCVTQPAVSQAIRRLEECAGVKLFVRRSGQPIPTEAGRRLFSFIERGVEWFASGENFLGRLSDPNAGEVTVGVSESACRFFILPHIKEMRQRFPDLKLKIKEGNTAQSNAEKLPFRSVFVGDLHRHSRTAAAVERLCRLSVPDA